MIQKTKAIVLNTIKYSDNTSIVRLYTEHFGAITTMIRTGKTKKARMKANMFQALFLLAVELDYKQNKDIQHCKEVGLDLMFNSIPFDITKSSIAMFLAEFLSRVLKEEEANAQLFEFLHTSIQLLDEIDSGVANFHLIFLYKLTKFLGLYPTDNYSSELSCFDVSKGCYSAYYAGNKYLTNKTTARYLHLIADSNFNSLNTISLSGKQRSALLNTLVLYYKYHLADIGTIKSLEVFNEIFS